MKAAIEVFKARAARLGQARTQLTSGGVEPEFTPDVARVGRID